MKTTCNRKYTWLPFLLLPPSGYSIQGSENCDCIVKSTCNVDEIIMIIHFWLIYPYARSGGHVDNVFDLVYYKYNIKDIVTNLVFPIPSKMAFLHVSFNLVS